MKRPLRLTTSLVVCILSLVIGLIWHKPMLWLPASGVVSGALDLLTRNWVRSEMVGKAVLASHLIKLLLSLVMVYAALAQFCCLGLLIYWAVA